MRVVVLGGGVAGLTVAHELAERGLSVTIIERRTLVGGKARSFEAPGTASADRPGLPAEHGFRFFPGSYCHLDETMARIPFGDNPRGVLDNLVSLSEGMFALSGRAPMWTAVRLPARLRELRMWLDTPEGYRRLGATSDDLRHMRQVGLEVLTSCEQRRLAEHDGQTWASMTGAAERSAAFRMLFTSGQTQNLVACKAEAISARTAGSVAGRLLVDLHHPRRSGDRVLAGPTQEMFIDPWRAHLERLGVRFRLGLLVEEIGFDGARVTGVRVRDDSGETASVPADVVVCALPVERIGDVLGSRLRAALPALAGLEQLRTGWMVGLQFYLDEPVRWVDGHINCIDSPWALTAIFQSGTWPGVDLRRRGDGTVGEVLSVDISNWNVPGLPDGPARGRCARQCSREEIAAEVWEQLRRVMNVEGEVLTSHRGWYLDESVQPGPYGTLENDEPLFINTAGAWQARPEATTAVDNLFLAGDWIRTRTDVASMESANEAGRRAANAILDRTGWAGPRCALLDPDDGVPGAWLRRLDAERFDRGEPWLPPAAAVRDAVRRRVSMTQSWEELRFFHWSLPAEVVAALLPDGLELDTHEGRAWVSLVSLKTQLPGQRLMRPFSQVNLRTYVRQGQTPGVHFLQVFCGSRRGTLLGRSVGLPYRRATIRTDRGTTRVRSGTHQGRLVARALDQAPDDALNAFLHERYAAAVVSGGRQYSMAVEHAPWSLRAAEGHVDAGGLLGTLGLELPPEPTRVTVAAGTRAVCRLPRRLP